MIKVIETDVWEENPEKKGYLRKVRNKTVKEVFDETVAFLKERDLYDELDYFSISHPWSIDAKKTDFPNPWRWIACYAVVGGSEGHYIHVDVIDTEGKREMIFIGKTFSGMDHALKVSNLLSKVFWEEIRE
jgi:hypothetical protein